MEGSFLFRALERKAPLIHSLTMYRFAAACCVTSAEQGARYAFDTFHFNMCLHSILIVFITLSAHTEYKEGYTINSQFEFQGF